jgi:hypothetical protein
MHVSRLDRADASRAAPNLSEREHLTRHAARLQPMVLRAAGDRGAPVTAER